MSEDIKFILQVVGIVAAVLFIFGLGVVIDRWRPVAACAEYAASSEAASVSIPMLPNGSDGVKCVTIRGMFEGPPSGWRYVGRPRSP